MEKEVRHAEVYLGSEVSDIDVPVDEEIIIGAYEAEVEFEDGEKIPAIFVVSIGSDNSAMAYFVDSDGNFIAFSDDVKHIVFSVY